MSRIMRSAWLLGAFALVCGAFTGCGLLGAGFQAGIQADPSGPVAPAVNPADGWSALVLAVGYGAGRILEILIRMGGPALLAFARAKVSK